MLVAEDPHPGGIEGEQAAVPRGQGQPARGEDPQDVPVREEEGIPSQRP